jgi:hypothetical protein
MAAGTFCWVWNAKKVVGSAQMKAYGDTYLQRYEHLVQSKVLPAYRKYFSFLKEKPFLIKASISTSHGSAVEFIPSDDYKFQCQTIKNRIEQGIFPGKNLNTSRAATVLGKHCFFKDVSLTCEMGMPIEISDGGSLRTKDIIANDINYPNTIIIKGSNRRSDWSRKSAKEDAQYYFDIDFRDAYVASEEFREFVATPELTNIANEIITKQKAGYYGGQYGYLKMKEDLAKLTAAANARGIKHEFTENILTFLKGQPCWQERHRIIYALMLTLLGAFLLWFLKWGWKWSWVKLGR